VAPSDPVGAADDSVLVRQTIRAVSHRHGLRVSFAPSVVAGTVGNGGHVHLSAWRDGHNLFEPFPGPQSGLPGRKSSLPASQGGSPGSHSQGGLPRSQDSLPGSQSGIPGSQSGLPGWEGGFATAGILAHLPALLAVGAPTPASYLRLVPSHWAGVFACWGVETREAALRFVPGTSGRPGAANLEVKCFDLAANPYLLTGALVAAALDGLAAGRPLPAPITGDPVHLPDAPRLPTTLDAATDAFAVDPMLREAMGEVLFDAVVAVRRAEADRLRDLSPEEVVAALRWAF
jgi:glutamine synthetase